MTTNTPNDERHSKQLQESELQAQARYNDPESEDYFDGTTVALSYMLAAFFSIFGPIIIYLLKKDSFSPWTQQAMKDVINFSISYFIYVFVAGLSIFLLIGFILLPVAILCYYIFTITAAVKNGQGNYYKPPLVINFI